MLKWHNTIWRWPIKNDKINLNMEVKSFTFAMKLKFKNSYASTWHDLILENIPVVRAKQTD